MAVQTRVGTAAGTFYYTYGDHLGSIVALSNTTGGYLANSLARYDPFGNYRTEPTTNPGVTNHGFTGHRHNNTGAYATQDIGLIYMNARYYLPEVGRFISSDTIVPEPGSPQSHNRYSYALNSPTNFTDPTGHKECGAKDDCSDPLPRPTRRERWQGSIIIQSSNVVVSTLPAPAGAITSGWRSFEADYTQLFGSEALSSAPGTIYFYYDFSNSDISLLLAFEIVARVLLAENYRLFLVLNSRFAGEVGEHWPQDAIAMAYVINHNAARVHQAVAQYVGPNRTASPLLNVPDPSALDLAYAVALGVDQGWLNDPSFGANWYFHDTKNATDNYLDNTQTGYWAAGTWWEPSFASSRDVHPCGFSSSLPNPYCR